MRGLQAILKLVEKIMIPVKLFIPKRKQTTNANRNDNTKKINGERGNVSD